jgi:hypothetical protein
MAAAQNSPAITTSKIGDADTRASVRAQFRDELQQRVERLGLTQNVAELDMRGYTVIKDPAPKAFFNDLKTRILELGEQRRKSDLTNDRRGLFSISIKDTLQMGRVFEEAIQNEKLNTLVLYLLGDGYALNSQSAIVLDQGNPALFVHTDNAFIPDPFPLAAQIATAVWFTEDMTMEAGASRVVPGSHHLARQPNPGEGEDEAIAVECPAGSIVMWNGATWHGNCGRSAPGSRVTLHTSFSRMHIRPFANNDRVPQEIIDRNPPLFAQLLGRGLPFGQESENGSDPAMMAHAARLAARRL